MNQAHSERAHAFLSASGSSRWINCTPSPRLEEHVERDSSQEADLGTLAHELGELFIRKRLGLIDETKYQKLLKKEMLNPLFYPAMFEELEMYVNAVVETYHDYKRKGPVDILIEERVHYEDYVPEGSGTCDNIIIGSGVLEVIDLKFGVGVRVEAYKNTQLMLYALGAFLAYSLMYDIHTVRVSIVQPRLDHLATYELTVDELLDWAETVVKPAAKKAWVGEGELKTGEWCKFCKVAHACSAKHDESVSIAQYEFGKPKLLSEGDILEVYRKSDGIISWLNSVKEYVQKEAFKGRNWPGFKVVEGRANRKISDDTKAIQALVKKGFDIDEVTNVKIKGLTDLEQLLGKQQMDDILGPFIERPDGGPKLVHEDDPRDEFGISSAVKDFS